MNQHFGPISPNPTRQESLRGEMSSSPMQVGNASRLQHLKPQSKRSVHMHRSLAFGMTAAGVILAVSYLIMFRPSTSAEGLAGILQMNPENAIVIRNATAIFVGFLLCGVLAGVTVHKADSHAHNESDVESDLGMAAPDRKAIPAIANGTGRSESSRRKAVDDSWDPDNIPPWLQEAMERIEEAHANGKRPVSPGDVARADRLKVARMESSEESEPDSVEAGENWEAEGEESDSQAYAINENSTGINDFEPDLVNSILDPVEWVIGNPRVQNRAPGNELTQRSDVDATPDARSQLERLRGIVSAGGLRNLEEVKKLAAAPVNGNGHETNLNGKDDGNGSRLSGLRGLASLSNLAELRSARHRIPLERLEQERDAATTTQEIRGFGHEATGQTSRISGFDSEVLPDSSLTGPGGRGEAGRPGESQNSAEIVPAPVIPARRRVRNLPIEEVQILPSWRGQYRKGE